MHKTHKEKSWKDAIRYPNWTAAICILIRLQKLPQLQYCGHIMRRGPSIQNNGYTFSRETFLFEMANGGWKSTPKCFIRTSTYARHTEEKKILKREISYSIVLITTNHNKQGKVNISNVTRCTLRHMYIMSKQTRLGQFRNEWCPSKIKMQLAKISNKRKDIKSKSYLGN